MEEIVKPNDPAEMKIARECSWLCRLFQKNKLAAKEKQKVIRDCIKDFKRKREEEKNETQIN
jgi:hypothetical protein